MSAEKVEEKEQLTCENAKRFPKWEHKNVEARFFRYGWNGFENAYEDSVDLCDDCHEAWQEAYR